MMVLENDFLIYMKLLNANLFVLKRNHCWTTKFCKAMIFVFSLVQLSLPTQVRMKAICVLESTLRKKNDEQFSIISSYFSENRDHILKCSDSPQVSLREKANKVVQYSSFVPCWVDNYLNSSLRIQLSCLNSLAG